MDNINFQGLVLIVKETFLKNKYYFYHPLFLGKWCIFSGTQMTSQKTPCPHRVGVLHITNNLLFHYFIICYRSHVSCFSSFVLHSSSPCCWCRDSLVPCPQSYWYSYWFYPTVVCRGLICGSTLHLAYYPTSTAPSSSGIAPILML